jgi:hypothetical protein
MYFFYARVTGLVASPRTATFHAHPRNGIQKPKTSLELVISFLKNLKLFMAEFLKKILGLKSMILSQFAPDSA